MAESARHIFMDEELAAHLEREFARIAIDGVAGDPNGEIAYAYLRVSSRGQAEEGRSGLPRQLEHVAEKAANEGLAIPWDMVYCDDHTGFSFEDRPALNALLDEVKERPRACKVVIEYPDRMSRDHAWRYGYIREQFQQCGIEYVYWEGYHSEIERSVLGTLSEEGMRKALERMHYGTLKKARSGRVTAKTPAYGYKFVDSKGRDRTDPDSDWRRDKHYAIDEEQAKVMRLVYHQLAYEGSTLVGLANYLNDVGVPPPKRCKYWSESLLSKMVKNTVYRGEFVAHRWYYKKVWSERCRRMTIRKFQRPREEWITVPVPAIVDTSTWELAQEAVAKNWVVAARNTGYEFLLTNLLVCAQCRHSYSANIRKHNKNGKTYLSPTYRCSSRAASTRAIKDEHACTQSQISAKILDPIVWQVVMNLLTQPEMLTHAIDEYQKELGSGQVEEQLELIKNQIAEREREDEKLYRAYIHGAFDEEEYANRRRHIKEVLHTLDLERERLEAQILSYAEFSTRKQTVSELLEEVKKRLLSIEVPFELRRKIVKMLIDHIEINVNERRFTIHGILSGTFSIDEVPFATTLGDMGSSSQ